MAINDNGLSYRHPHVTSIINNTDVITATANENISFFYAIASEKGVDNKVQVVSSSKEFLNNYGNPNMGKYGQAAYNILNLLDGGAAVYVLRVLPGDATFAHAFLNIQTKVELDSKPSKIIKYNKTTGEATKMENVFLRPCTTYVEGQINDIEGLEAELRMKRNSVSIDGYKDNLLFCMYPVGRGEAYNNLAFRININTSYDEVYDFRVYTLEIISYDEYNNANIIEGPYYVSLDPDAMSSTGESMFIVDILNTYSKVLNCIFNEESYDEIAKIINPYVAPASLDIITGVNRIKQGKKETYFDSNEEGTVGTQQEEDVCVRLYKYNVMGDPVIVNGENVLNVADDSDTSLNTMINIDNALRAENYNYYKEIVDKMKKGLGDILNRNYESILKSMVPFVEDVNGKLVPDKSKEGLFKKLEEISQIDNEVIKEIYGENGQRWDNVSVEEAQETVLPEKTILKLQGSELNDSENVTLNDKLYSLEENMDSKINDVIDELKDILSYFKLVPDAAAAEYTEIESHIDKWRYLLSQKDSMKNRINILINVEQDIDELIATAAKEESINIYERLACLIEVLSVLYDDYVPVIEECIYSLDDRYACYTVVNDSDGDGVADEKGTKVKPFEEKLKEILNGEYELIKIELENLNSSYLTEDFIKSQIDNNKLDDEGAEIEESNLLDRVRKLTRNILSLLSLVVPLYYYSKDAKILLGYPVVGSYTLPLSLALIGGSADRLVEKISLCCEEIFEKVPKNVASGDIVFRNFVDAANNEIANQNSILINKKSDKIYNRILGTSGISTFSRGNDGSLSLSNDKKDRERVMTNLLSQAYKGLIDEDILNKQVMRFKYLLDANYPVEVKNAMVSLVRDLRQDLFVWLDTEFCYSPLESINWRVNKFPVYTNFGAIYTQHGIVYDDYNGKDIKVSTSYILSQKIPYCYKNYGLQYPIAGSRRGVVDQYKNNSISYYPNALYKDQLYTNQINYIETDGSVSKFGSQLTCDNKNTPLSNINNSLTILDIKRNVELMAESLLFEFNTDDLASSFQQELNTFLNSYVTSNACETISASVYASDYDKQQKILRISITIKFLDIIEKVIISLDVVK